MRKYLILSILVLQIWNLGAQGYYCKYIGIENGLSQSTVTAVEYDDNGALWIGTRYGLNEYRNGKLRPFIDGDEGGIVGTCINFIHCDRGGRLWTSTDKGIFLHDPATDSFRQVWDAPATCAADGNGGVWFGTHFGLKYCSASSVEISGEDTDKYTDYLLIFHYRDTLYSIDRRLGLFRHTDAGAQAVAIDRPEGSIVMAATVDDDRIYLSIRNFGLVCHSLSEGRTLLSLRSGEGEMPSELILSLLVIDGKLWLGFDGAGVQILDPDTFGIRPLGQPPYRCSRGIPPSVTTLGRDIHGNIWIGSVRSGLLGLKQSSIKSFSINDVEPGAENVIISVLPSRDGFIYLGTDGSGICRYGSAQGIEFCAYHNGLKITSLADFDDKRVAVATYNAGLYLMDRETSRLTPFTLVDAATDERECFNSNAPSIYNLGDGRILFLAVGSYLYDKGGFTPIADKTDGQATELVVIGVRGNDSYYAYSSSGLYSMNIRTMEIDRVWGATSDTGSINTAVYHGGLIYMGSNYGLFTYDPRTSSTEKWDSGLFSRVSRLQSNGTDNLWVAADNSLFLLRNGRLQMVGENRGVPANDILSGACAADGTVYLGGTAGLVEIGSESFFITDVGKAVELRDPAQASLSLAHDYPSLNIAVDLAGADPFERTLYRYRLSGASELDVETFEDGIALPALKPGRYGLDVSYLKSDGSWSDTYRISDIEVCSPWYGSMPMLIIYLLIITGLAVFGTGKMSRRRVQELEAELLSRDSEFSGKIESFIDGNLQNPDLDVNTIAAHMAMSRAKLYSMMGAAYGRGVAEVIEARRMAKAEELLRGSSLPVLEISEKVGYSSPRYFSTRFKHLHGGLTPMKFRNTKEQ